VKGATHNSGATRTDVALYGLNHKRRGHLRDLENSQVTLAVIADKSVSGQQSFIIDSGERVLRGGRRRECCGAGCGFRP